MILSSLIVWDENGGYVELINNNTGFYGRCVDSVFIDGELMYVVRGPVLDSFSDYAQQEGIYLVNGNGRSQLCVTHDMIAELTTQILFLWVKMGVRITWYMR